MATRQIVILGMPAPPKGLIERHRVVPRDPRPCDPAEHPYPEAARGAAIARARRVPGGHVHRVEASTGAWMYEVCDEGCWRAGGAS